MNFINLKSALRALLKNKFYSVLSILGVALTFLFLCLVFMFLRQQKGNIAPETNKDRTIAVDEILLENKDGEIIDSSMVKQYLRLKIPEHIGFLNDQTPFMLRNGQTMRGITAYVNAGFFHVFEFDYLAGRAFADDEENLPVTVITNQFAKNYFGKTDVVGEKVDLLSQQFKVIGVVEKPNFYTAMGIYDLYIPYAFDKFIPNGNPAFVVYLKAKNTQGLNAVRDELQVLQTQLYKDETLSSPPVPQQWPSMKEGTNSPKMALFFTAILFLVAIPGLNMLSLNTGKMTDQMGEIAIKKVYGCTRWNVFSHLFLDNLVVTAAGALIGLLLTKPFIYLVNTLVNKWSPTDMSLQMSADMQVVAVIALLVVVFSLFSCFIPAWAISGKKIIEGLKGGNYE